MLAFVLLSLSLDIKRKHSFRAWLISARGFGSEPGRAHKLVFCRVGGHVVELLADHQSAVDSDSGVYREATGWGECGREGDDR